MSNKKKKQEEIFKQDFLNTDSIPVKQYKIGDRVKFDPKTNYKEKNGYKGNPTFSEGEIIKVKPDDKYDIKLFNSKEEILEDYEGKYLNPIEKDYNDD